jgi:hypothetical protein
MSIELIKNIPPLFSFLTLSIVVAGAGIIFKIKISRKSKDISIKIGKIRGNNNSIAGRDVTKN